MLCGCHRCHVQVLLDFLTHMETEGGSAALSDAIVLAAVRSLARLLADVPYAHADAVRERLPFMMQARARPSSCTLSHLHAAAAAVAAAVAVAVAAAAVLCRAAPTILSLSVPSSAVFTQLQPAATLAGTCCLPAAVARALPPAGALSAGLTPRICCRALTLQVRAPDAPEASGASFLVPALLQWTAASSSGEGGSEGSAAWQRAVLGSPPCRHALLQHAEVLAQQACGVAAAMEGDVLLDCLSLGGAGAAPAEPLRRREARSQLDASLGEVCQVLHNLICSAAPDAAGGGCSDAAELAQACTLQLSALLGHWAGERRAMVQPGSADGAAAPGACPVERAAASLQTMVAAGLAPHAVLAVASLLGVLAQQAVGGGGAAAQAEQLQAAAAGALAWAIGVGLHCQLLEGHPQLAPAVEGLGDQWESCLSAACTLLGGAGTAGAVRQLVGRAAWLPALRAASSPGALRAVLDSSPGLQRLLSLCQPVR